MCRQRFLLVKVTLHWLSRVQASSSLFSSFLEFLSCTSVVNLQSCYSERARHMDDKSRGAHGQNHWDRCLLLFSHRCFHRGGSPAGPCELVILEFAVNQWRWTLEWTFFTEKWQCSVVLGHGDVVRNLITQADVVLFMAPVDGWFNRSLGLRGVTGQIDMCPIDGADFSDLPGTRGIFQVSARCPVSRFRSQDGLQGGGAHTKTALSS